MAPPASSPGAVAEDDEEDEDRDEDVKDVAQDLRQAGPQDEARRRGKQRRDRSAVEEDDRDMKPVVDSKAGVCKYCAGLRRPPGNKDLSV